MNVINNVSNLYNLPTKQVDKIINTAENVICHDVLQAYIRKQGYIILDIGIGTLTVDITNDYLEYKFVPSKNLESKLVNTLDTKQDILIQNIEQSIVAKITNAYKELI